jgi:hypothetical protein
MAAPPAIFEQEKSGRQTRLAGLNHTPIKMKRTKSVTGGNPGAVLCCASEQPNRGDRLSWRALLENKNLSGNEKSGRAAPTPWELERGNNTNHKKKTKSDRRLNQGNKTGLKRSLDA